MRTEVKMIKIATWQIQSNTSKMSTKTSSFLKQKKNQLKSTETTQTSKKSNKKIWSKQLTAWGSRRGRQEYSSPETSTDRRKASDRSPGSRATKRARRFPLLPSATLPPTFPSRTALSPPTSGQIPRPKPRYPDLSDLVDENKNPIVCSVRPPSEIRRKRMETRGEKTRSSPLFRP